MSKIYNWGIIGLGNIANKFAEDLALLKNARLHAVASRSLDKAKQFAEKYQAPHHYGTYAELMQCPELDVVYIATPHTSHCEHTMMCLEHQIPVLCEKPFAMNAAEVRRMITLARFQKTYLMEALWTRFLPTIYKTQQLIEEGSIGDLISVRADFGFKANFDPKNRLFNHHLGGGALLDVGIYPVFLSLLLFGKPSEVKAMATIGSTNVDENCSVLLKYPENKIAVLYASITAKTHTEAWIYGSKGCIRINSRWHEPTSLTLMVDGEAPKDIFFHYSGNGYDYEARAVMEDLSKGKKENGLMNHDFSLDLIELLDKIRQEAGIFYPQHDHVAKDIQPNEIKFSTN
ncbi:MAG: Gfo/Idh/MocA family oxidoreductase [Bacteroidota bacterium]